MTNAEAHARASRRARPRAGSAAPNGRSPTWGNAWYGDETARGAGVPQRQRGASPAADGVKRSIFEPGEIPGLEGDTGGGADDDTHHDEQEHAGEYELRANYRPPSQPRPPPSPQQHQRADYNDIYQQEWPHQQNGYQQYEAPTQQAKPKMRFDDWLAEAEGTPAQGNAARRRQQAAARRSGRLPQLVGARGAGSPSVAGSVASRMSLGVPRLQHNRPKGMRGPSPPPKPGSVVGSVDMYGSPQADPRWRPAVQRADREGREKNRAGSLGLGMLPEKGTELSHTPSKGRRHNRTPSPQARRFSRRGPVSEAGSRQTNMSRMSWMSRASGKSLAHQSSEQVGNIFNPVRGIRDEMRRAGYKPVDHHRHNMRALRQMQRQNQARRLPPLADGGGHGGARPGIGQQQRAFRARRPPRDKYAAIREQHKAQRAQRQEDEQLQHQPGPPGRAGSGRRRLAPLAPERDEAAALARQQEERRAAARELRQMREEEARVAAEIETAHRDAPPGTTLMPDEERLATLEVVMRKAAIARCQLREARSETERAEASAMLDEMEEAIGIFSKRHVWIKDNDDGDDP
eukprot:PRCOL_00001356-RA